MPEPERWLGCYSGTRRGLFPASTNVHPAKMAVRLAFRIFAHGERMGYWEKGDLILDPLAGIFTTGIVGAVLGYRVLGIELEDHFLKLARVAIHFARAKFHPLGSCEIVQGDARNLTGLLADGTVTSPPYGESEVTGRGHFRSARERNQPSAKDNPRGRWSDENIRRHLEVAMAASPPYAETHVGNPGEQLLASQGRAKEIGTSATGHGGKGRHGFQYSHDEIAQIGNLRDPGDIDAVLTSPPWENQAHGGQQGWSEPKRAAAVAAGRYQSGARKGHKASAKAIHAQIVRDSGKVYGRSNGQIGQTKGQTYLSAMFQVYRELHTVLKPNNVVALVLKNPVRDGVVRRLDLDTIRLMEACGFKLIEHIHAMLSEDLGEQMTIDGRSVKIKRERKSFFKRLHDQKRPDLAVDWEDVLFLRKCEERL